MTRTLAALFRATHPGPSLAVTVVAVVIGLSVGLEPWRLAVLGVAMLMHQFSVGWSNDWLDAPRDRAVGRTDKPIASGAVRAETVRTGAFIALALAVLLTVPLGWPATAAHLLFIGCGWAYNLGLKSTPFSLVAYAVGFGALPLVATLALPEPAFAAPWAIGAAALLGSAAHFANALPDLEDDAATRVRGLPQLIGAAWSGALTGVALVGAAVLVLVGPGAIEPLRAIGASLVAVAGATAGVLAATSRGRRVLFPLILVAVVLLVALLALSGSRLLA